MQVLHKCDNPMCVRPDHLFLGTHADNMHDMFTKERRPYSKGKAKITFEDAQEIRRLYLEGHGAPELATKYNMTKRNIYDIVNGATWKQFKLEISQEELLKLANQYEPQASSSPPSYRQATCVKCGKKMIYMWHLWLKEGGFKKECHMCFDCGRPYMVE
jgi:HNH endonuclease